jgi:hypothetical protein
MLGDLGFEAAAEAGIEALCHFETAHLAEVVKEADISKRQLFLRLHDSDHIFDLGKFLLVGDLCFLFLNLGSRHFIFGI